MRFSSCLLFACAALLLSASSATSSTTEEFVVQEQWAQFKLRFQKEYHSAEEESLRYENFKQSMVRAAWLNTQNPEATFGVTQFSDLSPKEFKRTYLGYRPGSRPESMKPKACQPITDGKMASLNADVDWRTKGAVSPVKDQGQCGSCWAFSAVEGVESAWFLKHNSTMPILSPQQVVSCDKVDGGCDGGDLPTAFKYIQDNGLETESSYPYTSGSSGVTGHCKFSAASVIVNITGFTYATPPCEKGSCLHQDEATLLTNLATTGPSSICVNAGPWQDYKSGVMSACSGAYDSLDHCVQLVGYQAGSPNYWIVRNSWGTSWGQQGYIYLAYGKNVCGVADEATFASSG